MCDLHLVVDNAVIVAAGVLAAARVSVAARRKAGGREAQHACLQGARRSIGAVDPLAGCVDVRRGYEEQARLGVGRRDVVRLQRRVCAGNDSRRADARLIPPLDRLLGLVPGTLKTDVSVTNVRV